MPSSRARCRTSVCFGACASKAACIISKHPAMKREEIISSAPPSSRSNPACPYPETLGPLPGGGNRLQLGILALLRQVHSTDDRGQWLKANELAHLSGRRRRQINSSNAIFGPKQNLHRFAAGFDGEV